MFPTAFASEYNCEGVYSVINIIEVFIGQILNLTAALFIEGNFPLIPVMRLKPK